MGDDDIANSVTLTGQSINKKNRRVFVDYLVNTFNIPIDVAENCCVAGDTDSGYFSLEPLNDLGYKLKDENGITPEFLQVCEDIEKHINDTIYAWCLRVFKTTDCRIVYKREAISDHAIFLAKKHYVMHILDDEGMAVDKFKYKGVAVVKGTMPRVLKPYVKKVIEHMILSQSLRETNDLFMEAYELFKELEVHNYAKIVGMKNYEVSARKCNGLTTIKGMPYHLKAAYFHDYVIKDLKLDSKYQEFKSGEKVRIVQLKTPNRYNLKIIAFRDKYPKEFEDIFIIDHELMFLKIFFKSIKGFYDVVNWTLRKPNENVKIELEDFFS
jgi:DNA polymerase elongation subunit (family B)